MNGPFKLSNRPYEHERDTLGLQISTFLQKVEPWVIPYSSLVDQDHPKVAGYACRECVRGCVRFKWSSKIFSTVSARCDHCDQPYTITSVP